MCSLIKACHQTYFEKECRDDHALGQQLRDVTAKWLETAPKDIEKSGLPNANVVYNDLIADPISTVKKIYDHFGWEFSKEYEHILNDFMEKDRQKREKIKRGKATSGKSPATSPKYSSSSSFSASSGKDSNMTNIYISQKDSTSSSSSSIGQDGDKLHTYLPEEFGLTEKELSEEVFATYIAKFNLPISRN